MDVTLQQALDLVVDGLLTHLPTQIVTASLLAVATAALRAWRRRSRRGGDRE
ncbi:hypothetical protein [Streptomyces sp. NPDC059491]|uniref:hypothetical protein n=1 Tax=Streptomyces sp. NPDC059491 TaxID=3346850 RepID=UPI0036C675F9